jgi:hypothetical protein
MDSRDSSKQLSTQLPPEIVIYICELTAEIFPEKAQQLSLLSTHLRGAILPKLVLNSVGRYLSIGNNQGILLGSSFSIRSSVAESITCGLVTGR